LPAVDAVGADAAARAVLEAPLTALESSRVGTPLDGPRR
jgi:hypothetical protein